jgi:hypothetical protein
MRRISDYAPDIWCADIQRRDVQGSRKRFAPQNSTHSPNEKNAFLKRGVEYFKQFLKKKYLNRIPVFFSEVSVQNTATPARI